MSINTITITITITVCQSVNENLPTTSATHLVVDELLAQLCTQ